MFKGRLDTRDKNRGTSCPLDIPALNLKLAKMILGRAVREAMITANEFRPDISNLFHTSNVIERIPRKQPAHINLLAV